MADTPPTGSDPRLEIPELLRTPVDRSALERGPLAQPKTGLPPSVRDGTMEQLVRIGTIGTNFVLAVAAVGLVGWAVQHWWLTSAAPWPLVVGLLLGLVVGALRFVRDARRLMARDASARGPGGSATGR